MKKNKVFTIPRLISLGILFIIVLIGTYILKNTYQELTDTEKEMIKEIDYLPVTNLTGVTLLVAVALVFICLILVDPFNMFKTIQS